MNKLYILLTLAFFAAACTKETVNAPYPYNELSTFSVITNTGDTIPAAISDSSIIIYWPGELAIPDSIAPQLTISENATVTPAGKQSVPFKTGTLYTVKAETGATARYKLKVVVNQPEVIINSDLDNIVRLEQAGSIAGLTRIIPDTALTKIWLVSTAGKETAFPILHIEDLSAYNYAVTFNNPTIDTGAYFLKVKSGIHTVTSAKPYVRVIYPTPAVVSPTTLYTVKRGETFTINGTNMRGILPGRARLSGTQTYYNLELVEFDLTHTTYRIPADYPTGDYNLLHLAVQSYNGLTNYIRVGTISPVLRVTQ